MNDTFRVPVVDIAPWVDGLAGPEAELREDQWTAI